MSEFNSIIGLDYETANSSRSSACAVAAVKYNLSGEKIGEYYTLVNPKEDFDFFNVMIHGIRPSMVAHSPEIDEAMDNVFALADPDSLFVCHNSAFDFSVMRAAQRKKHFAIPNLSFTCTYRLAKLIIPDSVSYTLPLVAMLCGVDNLEHHNAMSDADTCALILLSLAARYGGDIDEMHRQVNLNYGHIVNGEYDGIHTTLHERKNRSSLDVSGYEKDEDSPFYGKIVGFTGKLESMTREEAMEIINRIGGTGIDGLTGKTNFLITGYQDPRKLAGKEKSGKQIKAEQMLAKGKQIEIIPEEEFLKML